jgi:hypothetical protein
MSQLFDQCCNLDKMQSIRLFFFLMTREDDESSTTTRRYISIGTCLHYFTRDYISIVKDLCRLQKETKHMAFILLFYYILEVSSVFS